jgi:ribosomal protein S18 acetylase RimI-like enzyme
MRRVNGQSGAVPPRRLIRRATPDDADSCVAILARLPDYFTPDTHAKARAAIGEHLAWVALEVDDVQGFIAVETRYTRGAEITFAAVAPEHRRTGIGTHLVAQALDHLAAVGFTFVEVKTLDESAGYEPYVATRGFWERMGFVQIDRIDPLPGWQPGNPCAIYVRKCARHDELRQEPRQTPTDVRSSANQAQLNS